MPRLCTRGIAAFLLLAAGVASRADERVLNIRYMDVDRTEATDSVRMSVVKHAAGCDYRLEFDDPANRPNWAIHEIAGDQGPRQRYSNTTCQDPAFTVTAAANRQHYDEQTAYFWVMQARQFAVDRLWITPPNWTGPPIKHATTRVDPYVLSEGGFRTACFPTPIGGCFRVWPTEGPRIHLKTGSVAPALIAHEYGHYAAGYVFGHMDTFGFPPQECGRRAFQEAIAEMFMTVFLHSARYAYYSGKDPVARGTPRSSFTLTGTARWNSRCGTSDYEMGRPLVQAFHKSIWGTQWNNGNDANLAMARAFSTALAKNRNHRVDDMARDIIDYTQRTRSSTVSSTVTGIFRTHGFASINDVCTQNYTCAGPRTSRCDQTVRPRKCIPDDGFGKSGDYCTHNNQCDAKLRLVCRVRQGPAPQPGTCRI